MRYQKIVTARIEECTVESRAVCDGCGGPLDGEYSYDRTEVEIRATIGDLFPEADCRKVEEIDCCARCWTEKVAPAIQRLGFPVYHYDADVGRGVVLDPEVKGPPPPPDPHLELRTKLETLTKERDRLRRAAVQTRSDHDTAVANAVAAEMRLDEVARYVGYDAKAAGCSLKQYVAEKLEGR